MFIQNSVHSACFSPVSRHIFFVHERWRLGQAHLLHNYFYWHKHRKLDHNGIVALRFLVKSSRCLPSLLFMSLTSGWWVGSRTLAFSRHTRWGGRFFHWFHLQRTVTWIVFHFWKELIDQFQDTDWRTSQLNSRSQLVGRWRHYLTTTRVIMYRQCIVLGLATSCYG